MNIGRPVMAGEGRLHGWNIVPCGECRPKICCLVSMTLRDRWGVGAAISLEEAYVMRGSPPEGPASEFPAIFG